MPKNVSSFKELEEYVQSFGIDETEAIHIAESFMDKNKIDFDVDKSIFVQFKGSSP